MASNAENVSIWWRHHAEIIHKEDNNVDKRILVIVYHASNCCYNAETTSRVSCQKGATSHAYAWQIAPFWQDTLDMAMASQDSVTVTSHEYYGVLSHWQTQLEQLSEANTNDYEGRRVKENWYQFHRRSPNGNEIEAAGICTHSEALRERQMLRKPQSPLLYHNRNKHSLNLRSLGADVELV